MNKKELEEKNKEELLKSLIQETETFFNNKSSNGKITLLKNLIEGFEEISNLDEKINELQKQLKKLKDKKENWFKKLTYFAEIKLIDFFKDCIGVENNDTIR